MGDECAARHERIDETLALLRRVHPQSHPSLEDIAELHELHARHEFALGNVEVANEALARARRTRDWMLRREISRSMS